MGKIEHGLADLGHRDAYALTAALLLLLIECRLYDLVVLLFE